MDTREYISSGILESYAMGFCSDQERREVECLSSIYPEIQEELKQVLAAHEKFALSHAEEVPSDLEDTIWLKLKEIEKQPETLSHNQENVDSSKSEETPIIQLQTHKNYTSIAAVLLLLLTSGFLMYFISANQRMQSNLNQTLEAQHKLQNSSKNQEKTLTALQKQLEIIALPSTRKVILTGVASKPSAKASVFFNEAKKSVILTGLDLPEAPEGKQYQLWALYDGKPIDAGVFDVFDNTAMLEMKKIEKSQAFAITLEPKGGSVSPHLEDLCVIGNL